MISFSEIKRGTRIILNGQPHEVLESSPMFQGRGHSVLQTKIKNLKDGTVMSSTFHPSDKFEETEIEDLESKFLYSYRGKFVFCETKNPSKRFELTEQQIGDKASYLKSNQEVIAQIFEDKIINIAIPIKVFLKVKEAAPGLKGDSSQSPEKTIILETGLQINAPLFVEEGDIIEINTETGQYVRRMQ